MEPFQLVDTNSWEHGTDSIWAVDGQWKGVPSSRKYSQNKPLPFVNSCLQAKDNHASRSTFSKAPGFELEEKQSMVAGQHGAEEMSTSADVAHDPGHSLWFNGPLHLGYNDKEDQLTMKGSPCCFEAICLPARMRDTNEMFGCSTHAAETDRLHSTLLSLMDKVAMWKKKLETIKQMVSDEHATLALLRQDNQAQQNSQCGHQFTGQPHEELHDGYQWGDDTNFHASAWHYPVEMPNSKESVRGDSIVGHAAKSNITDDVNRAEDPVASPCATADISLDVCLDKRAREAFDAASPELQIRVKKVVERRLRSHKELENPSSFVTHILKKFSTSLQRSTETLSANPFLEDVSVGTEFPVFERYNIDRRAKKKLRSLSARRRRQIKKHINDSPFLRNPSAMVMYLASQFHE